MFLLVSVSAFRKLLPIGDGKLFGEKKKEMACGFVVDSM